MLQKEYRELLLDRMFTFLWRQWSALGVMGTAGIEDEWIIDPEPLLVFSLGIGRYEPRLFDEILAWLQANGHWLDTARIRQILRNSDREIIRVVGGALIYLSAHGEERKWKKVAQHCEHLWKSQPVARGPESLFWFKDGRPHSMAGPGRVEPSFLEFGLNRPAIRIQKEAKEVSVNSRTNIRFLLRSLFGTGAKSEAILYLLTHEGGRPRDIAENVGLFWLSIHQALLDLSRSGLVLTRRKGKRVEYWLSSKRWWSFLSPAGVDVGATPLKPLNWIAIYSALWTLWKSVDQLAAITESEYMKTSKFRDSVEILVSEFARAGYDTSSAPSSGLPLDLYHKLALKFLSEVFSLPASSSSQVEGLPSPRRGEGQGEESSGQTAKLQDRF